MKSILLVLLLSWPCFAADFRIKENTLRFGLAASGDKTIEFNKGAGSSNPKIRWNETSDKLQFSNDGTTFSDIGTGTGSGSSYYSGYHANDCGGWTRANTAYGDFAADATCTLNTRLSSGISASATGSVLPALSLTLPSTGIYHVCAYTGLDNTLTGGQMSIGLTDGTTMFVEQGMNAPSANQPVPIQVCGLYSASSTSVTLTIQGKIQSGTARLTAGYGGRAIGNIEWMIIGPL